MRWLWVLWLLPVLVWGGEYESQRAAALSRPRRIIVNSDGSEPAMFAKGEAVTADGFYALKLSKMRGAGVDTVCWCVNSFIGWRSEVEPPFLKELPEATGKKNGVPALFALGTDTLKLSSEFCRREGIEYFASFRMNDTHDAAWNPKESAALSYMMRSDKLEHREWLLG